jgi:fibronectin-binding autotransporter adhesin
MKKSIFKARRIGIAFAFVLSVLAAQFAGVLPAYAAAVVWDGGGANNNFSTAANWSTDTIPVNGDTITFDNTGLTVSETVTNDLVGLSVAGVNFTGANSYQYTVDGNALSVGGAINGNGSLDVDLTLTANTTVDVTSIGVAGNPSTLDTAGFNLSLNSSGSCGGQFYSAITGSGDIAANLGEGGYNLHTASPAYTGDITITSGVVGFVTTDAVGSASSLTANGGRAVLGLNGADRTLNTPISLGGMGSEYQGALSVNSMTGIAVGCKGGGDNPQTQSLTLAGGLTLLSDATYRTNYANIYVSNPYTSNGHSITAKSGSIGTLTLPDGTAVETQPTITEYKDNAPDQNIYVEAYETAIVSGAYGNTSVDYKGILKGTGTVDSLYVGQGGTLAPGNSPGKLTVLNSVNLQAGSTYSVEILNTSSYDQLAVTNGPVNLDGKLDVSLFGQYSIKQGDAFTIIDNQGANPVNGVFEGMAQDTKFTVNNVVFSISYTGGDGNDVVLTALNGGDAPAAPNTGVQMLLANPALVAGLGLVSTAALTVVARRRR